MPCRDYSDAEERSMAIDALNERTAMLCEAMRYIEANGMLDNFIDRHFDLRRSGIVPLFMRKWWEDHKRKDKERIKSEKRVAKENAAREEVLKKLTKAEIKLLGLDE